MTWAPGSPATGRCWRSATTGSATPSDREIRIEREFAAPRDQVYAAYIGAERDGMLASGMEGGLNDSYSRLDELLADAASG